MEIKQGRLFDVGSEMEDMKVGSASAYNKYTNYDNNTSLLSQLTNNRGRKETINRIRKYVTEIGLLYRIIKLKTDFIASGFKITSEDKKLEEYYNELYDDLKIDSFIRASADELQMVGEFYNFKSYKNGEANNLSLLDPNRITVKSVMGKDLIYLRPTPEIQGMLNSDIEEEKKLIRQVIPPKIARLWKEGKEALLDEETANRYYLNKPDFEKYPESPIKAIFKDLELLTTLIDGEYANAVKLKEAILHIKVGDKDINNGVMPKEVIDGVQKLFDNPSSSSTITTQHFVNASFISPDSTVFDETKYKAVTKRILNWSNINVFIEEGGSYSQGFIKLKALRQDIENARSLILRALNDFNKQIAIKKGFTTYGNKPKIPKLTFDDNSMKDDKLSFEITKWLHQQGLLSIEDTIEKFDYNFADQKNKKKDEIEEYGDNEDNIWRPVFETSQGLLQSDDSDSSPEKATDPGNDSQPKP